MRIAVCGMARSGTSMMMRMLHAGGIRPIAGTHDRSYELDTLTEIVAAAPHTRHGEAVKLLETLVLHPELDLGGGWRFVYTDRDPREQTKSQMKLLREIGQIPVDGTYDSRPFERSLRRDRVALLVQCRRRGDTHVVPFEKALESPLQVAHELQRFVAPLAFDPFAAAAIVHVRSAKCAPDLSFELDGKVPDGQA